MVAQNQIGGDVSAKLIFTKAGNKLDRKQRGVSMIIYAPCGYGKSTLATTLPPEETLIINAEAGISAFLGCKHTIFDLKDDLSQLAELYKYLRAGDHPFKYVVVDNISELENWFINTLTKIRGKEYVSLAEYGDASFKEKEYIHLFRDLTYQGITVIFNAWQMELDVKNYGGEIVTISFPKLFKKVAPDMGGLVDMVGRLELYPKTGDRFVRFQPTAYIMAKTRLKGVEQFEPVTEIRGTDPPRYEFFMPLLDKIYNYDYSQDKKEKK